MKGVAKSRVVVNFEQQILALLLVLYQAHNLSHNKCCHIDPHQANQSISVLHFFNPQQILLLRDRLIMQGEKRGTLTQNLQQNNVAGQVEGFCISHFAALSAERNIKIWFLSCMLTLLSKPQIWWFHVIVMQRISKIFSKIHAARAARLFLIFEPMISLFCGVVVALSSFLKLPNGGAVHIV